MSSHHGGAINNGSSSALLMTLYGEFHGELIHYTSRAHFPRAALNL